MATDPKKLKQAEDILKKINAIYRELGKVEIKLNTKDIEGYPGILREARGELSEMEGSATNLYEQLRGVTQEIKGQQTSIQKARGGFRDITKAADDLLKDEQEIEKLNTKQLKSLRDKAISAKKSIELGAEEIKNQNKGYQQIQRVLENYEKQGATQEELLGYKNDLIKKTTALTDEEKAILAAAEDNNSVTDEIIKKAQDRLAEEERIEEAASNYAKTAKFISSIPGLKAFAGPFEKAAAAAKEAAREGKSAAGVFKAAAGEAGKSALLQGVALGGIFKFVKDALFSVNKKQVELSKNFGVGEKGAKRIYDNFKATALAAKDNAIQTGTLIKANSELADIMGTQAVFSDQQLKTQVLLTKKMGLQAQTAGTIQSLSMASGQSTADSIRSINEQNAALKLQTGITMSSKELFKEVAEAGGQISANYANNPGLIAKAVTQVRKLGLSLSQAGKMASSMLDFESSIANEMEAEVLLGKDLNLDRARALALQGDAAGAAAEIAKQVGSAAEFAELNVVQQNALAAAAGMTADELANSLVQRENLDKLGAKEKKRLQEQVKQLKAQGKVEEANRLMSLAGNADELAAAQERLTFEQRIEDAKARLIERLQEMITANGGMEAIVERIVGFFESLPQKLQMIKGLIATITGVVIGLKIASLGASIAQAALAAGLIASASAATLGIGVAAIAAGMIAGGIAYSTMTSKNKKAAKQNMKDGVIGPDGGMIVSGQKGSIQLDKKDSIVAGTNLGGNGGGGVATEKLMQKIDKLISIVEKGGNVYMDGSKVGEALVLSSKLST